MSTFFLTHPLGDDGSDDENDNSAQSDGEEPSNEASNESKSILEALSKDENILPALKWLKTCLDDELEDRRYAMSGIVISGFR